MRKLIAAAILLSMSLVGGVASAAPSNDDFASATVISQTPFQDTTTNVGSTTELGEPSDCGAIASTIWYSYTPTSDVYLQADTNGSNFDTVLAVYTGSAVNALTLVGCNDDSIGLLSRVRFQASAGETYHFQAGGFSGETGLLDVNVDEVPPPGGIAGTVTNEDGDQLANICVDGYDPNSGNWEGSTLTDASGAYVLEMPEGSYKVLFSDCFDGTYQAEWFDDQLSVDDANVLEVSSQTQTTGIDAVLAVFVQPPPDQTDVAVTQLSIDNVQIRTDYGDSGLYTGWVRVVHMTAVNLSEDSTGESIIAVQACPTTAGSCQSVGSVFAELQPGQPQDFTFKWNGLGGFGSYTVRASACPTYAEDTDWSNNTRSVDHYVIADGTGFGVGAGVGLFSSFC